MMGEIKQDSLMAVLIRDKNAVETTDEAIPQNKEAKNKTVSVRLYNLG